MTTESFVSRHVWRLALGCVLFGSIGVGSAVGGVAHADGPIVPKTEKKGSIAPPNDPITPKTEQKTTVPRPRTSLSMWCRGPLRMQAGNTVLILGYKAETAAGEEGRYLAPGECAFEDRALRRGEPYTIWFQFDDRHHEYASNMMPVLANCAFDSECVVEIGVDVQPSDDRWKAVRNRSIFTTRYRP